MKFSGLIIRMIMAVVFFGVMVSASSPQNKKSEFVSKVDRLISSGDITAVKVLIEREIAQTESNEGHIKAAIEEVIMADKQDLAQCLLTACIQKYPENKDYVLLRSSVYLLKQQLKQSNLDLSTYLNSNPNDILALSFRAENYVNLREYENAKLDYTRLIKLEPDNAVWFCRRGEMYSHLKMFDEALQDFDKALSLDRQNQRAFEGMEYARYKVFSEKDQ